MNDHENAYWKALETFSIYYTEKSFKKKYL